VLGDEYRRQVNNDEVKITPAAEALKTVVGELAATDVKILLANATLEETRALAKEFPLFDVVVSGGGAEEPPAEAGKIEGSKAQLIELGHKAMFAVVLGLYDNPRQPVRYQRVALDSRFPDSAEMKALMTSYQSQLEALGWDGLGLRPAAYPTSQKGNPLAGQFVGGASCKECHLEAWKVYSESPHARATQTLVDLQPSRQFDPECVSCHVTGWNPQEFYPYASGYVSADRTPELAGQSCENCHGPGAAHIEAERGSDKTLQGEWRKAMHQDLATADDRSCRKCHDLDNSINFDFKTYWPQIEH
jgi:mono/diheme cytochrome c family protein